MSTEQSRARYADVDGFAERDGVKIFYEVYGGAKTTVLLLPAWSIIHRGWKMQIRTSRFHRVIHSTRAAGSRTAPLAR
jgi:hypothetical protein